jgi:hypothetical protein
MPVAQKDVVVDLAQAINGLQTTLSMYALASMSS